MDNLIIVINPSESKMIFDPLFSVSCSNLGHLQSIGIEKLIEYVKESIGKYYNDCSPLINFNKEPLK